MLESLAKGPVPKIKSIDYNGKVVITFDREVKLYELDQIVNKTVEIDGKTLPALQVEVLPGEWSNVADLNMTWNATEKTDRSLTIIVTFTSAINVSASFEPDYFQVIFNDPLLCFSAGGRIIEKKNRLLTKNMPRQMPQTAGTRVLEVIIEVAVTSAKAVFVSNFALNFLLTAAMQ